MLSLEVYESSGNSVLTLELNEIANDLENNGYSFFGTKENGKYIYGNMISYGYVFDSNGRIKLNSNNFFKSDTTYVVKAPSEYNVAKQISKDLNWHLDDIVIYQQSHHGYNNAYESLETLGFLSRKTKLHAIALTETYQKTANSGPHSSSYYRLSKNEVNPK